MTDLFMNEEKILQLPKRNNYHYNLEYVDNVECMALYYKLTNKAWNKHIKWCKNNTLENKFNRWLKILVDVEGFEMINGYCIAPNIRHLINNGNNKYTPRIVIQIRKQTDKNIVFKTIHRHILSPPQEKYIDHVNHNTLDNRRCNLRMVTPAENNQNKNGAFHNSKTGIRGVSIISLNKGTNNEKQYYIAQVRLNNKHVLQKYFTLTTQGLIDAEKAVVEARLKYFTHSEMDKVKL